MEGLVCIFLQAVPFQRRVDLEVNGVECIWLEMLFPYSKSFLIVLFTDHQTRQDITQKILKLNLNRPFNRSFRKQRNYTHRRH